MAPLPESNTPRVFVSYQTQGRNHTMMVRVDDTVSDSAASEEISAFIEAMSPLLAASLFVKAERSAEGSNVRVPMTWSGITEWGIGGSGDDEQAPLFYSFTGKDTAGRKFRLEIFGRNTPPNANWRVYEADDSSIGNALDALETVSPVFLTIAGNGPIFNQYANQSISQHWVGQARK